MNNANIHRQLFRQINKYLSDDCILNNEGFQKFIDIVNSSYISFDRDNELSEQASLLNDSEYNKINKKLRKELKKNILIKDKLLISKTKAERANEAKSEFFSMMSHEIRTPLNAIIGLIYIMEKENSLNNIHENLNVLKNSAQNLYLLINDILDFNKIEAGKVVFEQIPFDFKELVLQIEKSYELKAMENFNRIEVLIDENFTKNIIGDPLRIGQIITNLVSNAIKFTQNGLIQIKISQIKKDEKISTFKVEVIDTGIGIDINDFQHIFNKFEQADKNTTRKYGGTGLGLFIAKKLLELLNSQIELESEIDKGSTFSFDLQLGYFTENPGVINEKIQNGSKVECLKGIRILLVEDNLINTKVALKILSQWGVTEVDTAFNGQIATEMYEVNKYDVILMDLAMPIMDGYEATSIIRNSDVSIPIIALTASTSNDYLEKAMSIGFNEYIVKPFNPMELNLKLKKYCKNNNK